MIIVRGANSLSYPGSPVSDWIIGEQVDIVAAIGFESLNVSAYVCGKTQVQGMFGLYDALVLRCSPPGENFVPTTPPPPNTENLKTIFVRIE